MEKEIFEKLEKEREEGLKLLLNDEDLDLTYEECISLLNNAKDRFELMSKAFCIGYLCAMKAGVCYE